MSDVAIRVEGLGKEFRIGQRAQPYQTLRDTLANVATLPKRLLAPRVPRDRDETHFWALRDVSFEVHRGDVVGVIGHNGSGKSTLLKILSRITEPSEGFARIQGRVGSLLEVGTGFHPELTGRENTYLNGAILGMRRAEVTRKFDEIVAFSGVENFIDTPVKHYSSGMYLRLAFAVAAHLEPEILLIDEVLAVGDAEFQRKCLGKMRDVAAGGRTVLFVSHNLSAISQLCNRAIWLDRGSICADTNASRAVAKYLAKRSVSRASVAWPDDEHAPGDERVRLLGASLLQHGEGTPVLDINIEAEFELTFRVLQPAENLITGVSLYDASDLCLFASADWRPNSLQPGVYRKSVRLPAYTMSEGRFSALVQLVFYDPDIRSVVLPNALSFESCDSEDLHAVRGHYKGEWPGVMRLGLEWSDEKPI